MPITVKHGVDYGNAGEIMSRAVQGELERSNQRSMQMKELMNRGAIASAQIQGEYNRAHEANQTAVRMAAMKAGLAQDMQREEYMQSLMQAKEKGRQDASNTEYKYTTEQRIEDAKFARAERLISNSSDMNPEEKSEALRRIAVARAGIREPTEILGDPNKMKFPEGQNVGDFWSSDDGAVWTRDPDGKPRKSSGYRDSKEYLTAKATSDLGVKELEVKSKRQEFIDKTRLELLTKEVKGEDKDGNPTSRMRDPEEVEKILQSAGLVPKPEPQQQQEQNWWEPLQAQGWQVTQEDVDLPQEVGGSQAYIRTLNAQYGGFESVPDELKQNYISAARVLRNYRGGNRGLRQAGASQSKFKPQ